jgi:hypothetical protein
MTLSVDVAVVVPAMQLASKCPATRYECGYLNTIENSTRASISSGIINHFVSFSSLFDIPSASFSFQNLFICYFQVTLFYVFISSPSNKFLIDCLNNGVFRGYCNMSPTFCLNFGKLSEPLFLFFLFIRKPR